MIKRYALASAVAAVITAGCTTTQTAGPIDRYEELNPATDLQAPAPDQERARQYDPEIVAHGRYLVQLLGCGTCHTDGALIGEPTDRHPLSGSTIGIAYSDPLKHDRPGVVYPANLTPDTKTGLGGWNDEEILKMILSGVDRHGRQQLSIMPWTAYSRMSNNDARAIVAYLRSLPAVEFEVPRNVKRGEKAPAPFVHFGVYRSKR